MIYGTRHRHPRRATSSSARRRGHLRLDRRRRDQRGRVLGVAEHRLHAAAAGALPGRGQRLRDLGAGRGADARRRHLAAGRELPRPQGAALRRHRLPRQLPRRSARRSALGARASASRRSCTPRSPGPTRTRSRTTSGSTRRRRSARPRRRAIRSSGCAAFLMAEGLVDRGRAGRDRRGRRSRDRRGRRRRASPPPRPSADTAGHYVFSPDVDPTVGGVRHAGAARGQARHDGRGDQPHAARTRWRANPRIVVFGEDVADATHERRRWAQVPGQGRRLQGDARPAAGLRRRARLQLAAGRGQHRRPRRRHGARAASSRSSRSSSSTTSGRR